QHARSGGYTKVGFEGGQMPLQRRVPKRGFNSKVPATAELRLDALNRLEGDVSLADLKKQGIVPGHCQAAKVIASGELTAKVNLKNIRVTTGARQAIENAGGSVSE